MKNIIYGYVKFKTNTSLGFLVFTNNINMIVKTLKEFGCEFTAIIARFVMK